MIPFDVRWIDVDAHLASGCQPVFMLERQLPAAHAGNPRANLFNTAEVARMGVFWVPVNDLNQDPVEWTVTKTGTHVRVPVFAYRTVAREVAVLWASAIQLGIRAAESLRVQAMTSVEQVVLVLGNRCHDLSEQGLRCYAGMAFQVHQ